MITRERNPELYKDHEDALRWARLLPNEDHMHYHFYWGPQRPFGRKQAMSLKACITSQRMLHKTIHLWSPVWMRVANDMRDYDARLAEHVTIEPYPPEDRRNTPQFLRFVAQHVDDSGYLDSDFARLVVLYRFGGVWCDMDTVLLRDLYPLVGQEFLYQWGSELDTCAGGVIRAFPHSEWIYTMILDVLKTKPVPNDTAWGPGVWSKYWTDDAPMVVYPSALFNTEWSLGGYGLKHDPMRRDETSTEMYDGAFAWHWHNRWDVEPEEGSKWWLMEQRINEAFEALYR